MRQPRSDNGVSMLYVVQLMAAIDEQNICSLFSVVFG
jgi:hypothetical protein